jgi:hypothetical protein
MIAKVIQFIHCLWLSMALTAISKIEVLLKNNLDQKYLAQKNY